jgi:hypothetical protein
MINSAKAGEGSLSADTDPSFVADFIRATFSHKGRRKKGGFRTADGKITAPPCLDLLALSSPSIKNISVFPKSKSVV